MSESEAKVGTKPQLHLGRVLLVLVLGALVLAAGVLWGYFDVGGRIDRWRLPPLVEVSGRVYLDGEPLGNAQIATLPMGVKGRGAMAESDAQGRFSLRTDVDGDFWAGAYVGEHRLIILGFDPNVRPGPFKPPLITPLECSEFETTPLRIQVDRDPERNHVEFRLERKAASKAPPSASP